jgi:hypothetical protein
VAGAAHRAGRRGGLPGACLADRLAGWLGLLRSIASESLAIFGWVAMWRPAETFLYGWVPITRQRRVLRQLSGATVEVRTGS